MKPKRRPRGPQGVPHCLNVDDGPHSGNQPGHKADPGCSVAAKFPKANPKVNTGAALCHSYVLAPVASAQHNKAGGLHMQLSASFFSDSPEVNRVTERDHRVISSSTPSRTFLPTAPFKVSWVPAPAPAGHRVQKPHRRSLCLQGERDSGLFLV